ncbi:MAG: zinc-binding dehydrogenase [Fuerstiella sp.]
MKAAFIEETGPASVIQIGDVATPPAAAGQVLVRVKAVAVNPIDTYIRAGNVSMELPSPYIIGCDLAGVVEAVGSGVSRFQAGDRVWGSNQGLAGRQGTFAQFAAVGEEWLYPIPDNVSFEDAAAVALVGITAHLGLFLHGDLQAGETVFVNGGTGGVGSAVVQLAKAADAVVITTVGSEEKAEGAKQLGADLVINYMDQDVAQTLHDYVQSYSPINLWFETLRIPNPEATIPLLAKRGRYILMAGRDAKPEFPIGPFYVNDLRAIGFAMFNASAAEQQACAAAINAAMINDRFHAVIGKRLPLDEAATAHQLQEDKTLHAQGELSGKIVLTIDE